MTTLLIPHEVAESVNLQSNLVPWGDGRPYLKTLVYCCQQASLGPQLQELL
jgi:hypothetical protein